MTRHRAGKLEGAVQRCSLCGNILADYRNCMWPSTQTAPSGFPYGAVVAVHGGTSVVVDESPTEPMCMPEDFVIVALAGTIVE